jgi:pyridoxal phosphate enzyme (YggS family)
MTVVHKSIVNLLKIKEELKAFSIKKNCEIIAVSKTFTMDDIMPLIKFGHIHFGENKVQEALQKWTPIKKIYPNIKLHMLGKIQKNKAKYIPQIFDYVHSLDNLELAKKLVSSQLKLNKKIKYFIQLNLGEETQKNGLDENNLSEFYNSCQNFKLDIQGLMCIPPKLDNCAKYFRILQDYSKKLNLKDLSMGMSNDYLEAVKNGSTFIRVGSKIFGDRN